MGFVLLWLRNRRQVGKKRLNPIHERLMNWLSVLDPNKELRKLSEKLVTEGISVGISKLLNSDAFSISQAISFVLVNLNKIVKTLLFRFLESKTSFEEESKIDSCVEENNRRGGLFQ
jgi:hypothetical protein